MTWTFPSRSLRRRDYRHDTVHAVNDERIVELYKAGRSVAEIADEIGYRTASVHRVLRRNGVGRRNVDDQAVIELYNAGKPIAEIAMSTKSSWTSVYRVLDKHGVPRRRGIEADRQERIIELYLAGTTLPEIVRQVGCGTSSIWRVLRRAEVPRRRPVKDRPVPVSRHGAEMAEAYLGGRSLDSIAGDYDVSSTTIRNILLRRGVLLRSQARPPRCFSQEEIERIREMRTGGMAIDDIASAMHSHFSAVKEVLLDLGLASRPRKERVIGGGGYVFVRDEDGVLVLEHRRAMAQAIGRPLRSTETVHHINGNVTDNRLENLQLRQGNHGKGVVMTCNSCGSHDVQAREIAS